MSLQVNSPSCKVTPTRWSSRTRAPSHLCRSSAAAIHQRRSVICATIRRVNTAPLRQPHAPVSLLLFSFCVCACFYPITISWRLCSVTMCHAEAFMRSFFVSSICLLLFVCEDNWLQIVADNLLLCVIFLLPTAILSSKESLIMIFRFSQWKICNRNILMSKICV